MTDLSPRAVLEALTALPDEDPARVLALLGYEPVVKEVAAALVLTPPPATVRPFVAPGTFEGGEAAGAPAMTAPTESWVRRATRRAAAAPPRARRGALDAAASAAGVVVLAVLFGLSAGAKWLLLIGALIAASWIVQELRRRIGHTGVYHTTLREPAASELSPGGAAIPSYQTPDPSARHRIRSSHSAAAAAYSPYY